jgi:hypothetical protein
MEDPSCTHVKLEVKRIQHSHFYVMIKAYNSLARMNLEIHSILELYSAQYCSLLAKDQVFHLKMSEATIA